MINKNNHKVGEFLIKKTSQAKADKLMQNHVIDKKLSEPWEDQRLSQIAH